MGRQRTEKSWRSRDEASFSRARERMDTPFIDFPADPRPASPSSAIITYRKIRKSRKDLTPFNEILATIWSLQDAAGDHPNYPEIYARLTKGFDPELVKSVERLEDSQAR